MKCFTCHDSGPRKMSEKFLLPVFLQNVDLAENFKMKAGDGQNLFHSLISDQV